MDSIGQWGLGGWWPQLGGDGTDHNFHFDPADNDYDLDPYLVSGKLLWIAPGDGTALLREDAGGCPYRGLEGSHEATYIDRCEIWDSTRELDYFGGALGLYVEFNGAGMPPAQLDRLRSALALEPVEDRPREENAVLGRRKTGTDLPPGSYLLLMRGTPWRLELMCEGAYPTQRVLGKVRTRLLATLAELGLERLEVTQWRANGTPREY
jgi:hypothetical protein